MILLASLLVGRAILLALGRRQSSFLEGAVGFATLVLVCTVAIRLPGDEATSIACCAVLLVASVVFLLIRSESMMGPAVGLAIPVVVLTTLLASFPFIASGHIGIPGVGLNNDMAMHLVDVDYLVDPSRPTPQSVINGYPIGPHSLVGTVVSVLGTQPLWGWLGLLVAVPVLTGITALGALRELPGGRRLLAVALVAFAYLSASVLGIAGFKELIAGMFLIAFALGLREIEREPEGRIAIVIGLALITAAMVPVYSLPGVAWLAGIAGLWLVAHLIRIRAEQGSKGVRDVIRASMPIVIPAAIVLVLVFLTQLPKVIDFINSGSIGNVADTNSKLRYVVSPLETLGIWPSGNWLLGTHDVSHYWAFGAIGLAGVLFGLAWWIARRDYAVPAAVISGLVIWLATKYIEDGGLYILAKAVVVPASVMMLLVVTALLSPGGGWPKRIFAIVFIALAGYSTLPGAARHGGGATRPSAGAERLPGRGQRPEGAGADQRPVHRLRPANRRSLEPRLQCRAADALGGDEEPAAADRLRLGADQRNQRAERLPVRRHHQRDLPEPGAARLDARRLHPVVPALEAHGNDPADRQPLRGGATWTRPPLQPAEAGALRASGRRGADLAAAKRDREAALLEGGRSRGLPRRGWRRAREECPDRQPVEPGSDGQPDDHPAARQVGALAAVRQPRNRRDGQGPRG